MENNIIKILVIDDEKIIRDACERSLKRVGYDVTVAKDGDEAWQIMEEKKFHILLLDIIMPGMDGITFLKKLKELSDPPIVIVITGFTKVEVAVEAMKLGAYDLMTKPFSPDQLRLTVQRAVDKLALEWERERLLREQEKSLQDIATEKGRLITIINCMADGVVVTDTDLRIVLHNPAFTRLLNLHGELLGKSLLEVLPDIGLIDEIFDLLDAESKNIYTISREVQVGEDIFCMAHCAPILGTKGDEILGTVTVLKDISRLKELDRMKTDFVMMVSHDLRSPLGTIHQQLSVLLEGMAGELNEKQGHIIARAKERIDSLLELISNLLDLARIESGQILHHKESLNLKELIEECISLYKDSSEHKGLSLYVELAKDLPPVLGDRQNLREVFSNLLSNAIKYTPKGGKITVKTFHRDDYVHIEVSDTGMGIPKEDLPKIFDRFYRVTNERTKQIMGTGLGLPIVKKIVEAHLGSIEVESEVGKGSIFRVLLPVETKREE